MQTALLVLMWLPVIVLGHVLSAILFKGGSPASYVFEAVWPVANAFLAYMFCKKGEGILVIRLVTFFIFEVAALAIVLLYFG
ncbi:hypothetical protein SAMN02800692_3279 [Luteibacter sp. UNC138MFCol5.1]|uniref:hypothetical protein n=1 Tax=Luteibacter sp. UNC138MFCol5.1 TaxID=1502774 RepID=UPI0008D88ED6|nr:hypothetical protein [Luteibacter sp. UNC138MFCol5.1]SEP01769.1 hypothetical protein SAMN02800692_3279 [Luteibacter sp. UNC138MFCol5.1]